MRRISKALWYLAGTAFACQASGAQTVKPVSKMEAPGNLDYAMVCDGGGSVVGVAGEHEVYVWSLPSGTRRMVQAGLDGHIDPGAIACNRKVMAIGSTHGTVVVLDAAGREQRRLELNQEVTGLALSGDGAALAVTTANLPLQVLDVASGKQLWAGSTNFGNSYGVRFGQGDNLILAADGDTHVRAYDRKGNLLYAAEVGLLEPFDVSLSADGKVFAVAGAEGDIELHDSATGKLLKKSSNSGNPIFLLVMAPQGRRMIGFELDSFHMRPAAIAYWDPDAGDLKNLPLEPKTLLGIGRDEKSLLVVRQESPQQLRVESVE